VIGESTIYDACKDIPTDAPTPTPNDCDSLSVGDVFVFVVNTVDPDSIGFYTFQTMPAGLDLFLTDNPWNGMEFVEADDTLDGTLMVSPFTGGCDQKAFDLSLLRPNSCSNIFLALFIM
jgi:hypothetical protein